MPLWYYDKKELRNSPSNQDGLDYETECRYRREGARFIIDSGTKLGLRYDTMATGVTYFHRFYMFHSFKDFPRYVTACCCLFLAGKVEETPKKCKQIIQIAHELLSEEKFVQFGRNPKEEVMTLERVLLQTIKFDLQVNHPYGYLIKYAKSLKGDKKKLEKMVQMAWTFINDSLCTTLCLQWEPEIIAIALMYLASKLSKFEIIDWVGRIPRHNRWWDMFVEDLSLELLEDICHQVLDLYTTQSQSRETVSPPLYLPPVKTENSSSCSPPSTSTSNKTAWKESKKVNDDGKAKNESVTIKTDPSASLPQYTYTYPPPAPPPSLYPSAQTFPPTAPPPVFPAPISHHPPPPPQFTSYTQYPPPPVPSQSIPTNVKQPFYPPPPPPHVYSHPVTVGPPIKQFYPPPPIP